MSSTQRVRVGIAGLGRSGWGIHAQALQNMSDQYQVTAVSDPDESRARAAGEELGARAHTRFEELVGDQEVDLIVVATPNQFHAPHTIQAVEAGKHVVCDKPIGMSLEELDSMIAAAEKHKRVLAPFQQRRYDPTFEKVKQIVDSGLLGRIVQVRMSWHAFSRRWDWQTLQEFGGGHLNNNGPHLIDQGVAFFPEDVEPEVTCDMRRCITLGDADDHLKILLRAPSAPTIDMELSSAVAFPQDRWHVSGTAGGLRGDDKALEWKWVDWSACPPRRVERESTPDRSYNSEKLPWQHDRWENQMENMGDYLRRRFYEDLHNTLEKGVELVITPHSVRRRMALIDQCRAVAMTDEASELARA